MIGFRATVVEQGLASGETIFYAVIMRHSRFADLPAEKHYFGTEHARKVDQSLFDTFAYTAVAIDRRHPVFDLRHQF